MIEDLRKLIENSIDIKSDEKFCAILGLNPSQGARSPSLWNEVFKEKSLPLRMIPLDVSVENINDVFALLDKNTNFVAGALAVPYKEKAFNFFYNRLDETVKKIGAVNCLYRTNGKLTAVNTDGEGSISALISEVGNKNYEKVIILGSGGTAKAVAAFLSPDLGKVRQLIIAARNKNEGSFIANKCSGSWIDWSDISKEIQDTDLIINCTTIGSHTDINNTPISEIEMESISKSAIIYDVVYQPIETKLLKIANNHNLKCLGGLSMNLEQAVIACFKALDGQYTIESIREIMQKVD